MSNMSSSSVLVAMFFYGAVFFLAGIIKKVKYKDLNIEILNLQNKHRGMLIFTSIFIFFFAAYLATHNIINPANPNKSGSTINVTVTLTQEATSTDPMEVSATPVPQDKSVQVEVTVEAGNGSDFITATPTPLAPDSTK